MIAAFLLLAALAGKAQFAFSTNNGSVTITAYNGPGGAVIIPTNINGLPVTAIADEAFYERYSVTSLAIPDTVTNIGNYVFYNCGNMTGVTLPSALVNIGNYSFGRAAPALTCQHHPSPPPSPPSALKRSAIAPAWPASRFPPASPISDSASSRTAPA